MFDGFEQCTRHIALCIWYVMFTHLCAECWWCLFFHSRSHALSHFHSVHILFNVSKVSKDTQLTCMRVCVCMCFSLRLFSHSWIGRLILFMSRMLWIKCACYYLNISYFCCTPQCQVLLKRKRESVARKRIWCEKKTGKKDNLKVKQHLLKKKQKQNSTHKKYTNRIHIELQLAVWDFRN